MDRAWWATYSLWGRKESDTTERLSPSLLSLHPSLSIFAVPSSFASLTAKRSQNDALGQLEKYYCFFSIPLQSSVSFLVHPFFLFFLKHDLPDLANRSQAGGVWGMGLGPA